MTLEFSQKDIAKDVSDVLGTQESIRKKLSQFDDTFSSDIVEIKQEAIKMLGSMELSVKAILAKRGLTFASLDGNVAVKNAVNTFEKAVQALKENEKNLSDKMYVSEDAILDMMSKTLFGAVNAFKSKDLTKFLNDQQQELASISQDVALKTEAKADHADAIDATSRKVNADGTFTLQFSEKSKSPAVHDVLSVRDFTAENSVKVDYAGSTNSFDSYFKKHDVVATDTKQYYIVPGTDYAGNETFVIANEIVGKDGKVSLVTTKARALIWPGTKLFSQKTDARYAKLQNTADKAKKEHEAKFDAVRDLAGLDIHFPDTPDGLKQAEMLNTILDQKFNSFASTLQNLQAGAKEPPFDKNTLASGHMAFNYILPDGSKKYETVIVYDKNKYNTNPTYKALYDLLDDNEDALLGYLNQRRASKDTPSADKKNPEDKKNGSDKEVEKDRPTTGFIEGMSMNRGSPEQAQVMKNYTDGIMQKVMQQMKTNPPKSSQPFEDKMVGFGQFEYAGIDEAISFLTTAEINALEKQGITHDLTDDDVNGILVSYLNKQFAKKIVAGEIETPTTLTPDELKKKVASGDELTGMEQAMVKKSMDQELGALEASFSLASAQEFLLLYSNDEVLVQGELGNQARQSLQKAIDIVASHATIDAMFGLFQTMHAKYDTERHPQSAIGHLSAITSLFGQKIFAKAEKLPTEQKHKYLQSLMRQVTGRFEDHTDKVVASSLMVVTGGLSLLYPLLRNGKPGDIDDDLKDHGLAQQITQSLMPDIIEASNIKKDIDAGYQSEFESKKSAIIAAMPAIKINDTPLESADWSDMTQAQKTYVMSLMRYVDRFGDPKTDASLADLTDEEKTAEINKRSSGLVQHVSKEMADTFHQKIDAGLGMSAKDLGVTGTLGESYTLMSDYLGVGGLNISDTTEQYVVMGTKMVAVIAAAIAVTVATGGALGAAASAGATASISAMASLGIGVASAAAGSAAGFAADMIVNGREFESTEQGLKDFFSTLLVDSATSGPFAMIPGFGVLASRLPRLAKIFTISEAALSKSSRLRTLYNGTEMLTSAAASGLAEERRQRYVMDQDVAADQMIQQVGMGLFLPMAMKVPGLMSKIKLSPERGLVVSKTQEARNELVAASQGTHGPEKAMLEAKIKEADAVLKELDADLYDTVDKIDAELQNIVNKTSSDKASLEEFMIKYLKYVDSIKKGNSNLVNKLRTTSFKNLTDQDLADFGALLQKRDAMEKGQQAPKEPEAPKQAPNKQQPHQNPRPEPEANKQANSTNSTEPKKEPEVGQQTNKTEAQKQKVSAQEQMEKLEGGERLEFPLGMGMAAYLITKKSQKNSNGDTIHSYVIEHRSVGGVIGRSTQGPVEPLSLNASEMKDFLSNLGDTPYKKMSQILEPKLRADDFSKKESSGKEVGVDVNTTYKQKVDEHYNEIEPFMNDADAIVSSLEKRSNLTAQEKQILYHNQQKLIVWKMSLQDPNMTPDEKIAFKKQQIDWLEKNESYYVQYKQSVQLVKEFNSIAANVDHLPQLHENIANMTKQQIEDLQRKLGFEGNDVDGILGRDTRNAIEEHIEKKQKDSQDAKKADEPIEIRAEDIQDAEAVEMQKLNDSISSILEMTTNKINDLKSLGEMNLSNKQISELYYLSQRQLVLDKLMGNTVMSVKEKLEYKNNALQWLSLQNNNQAQYKEAVGLLSSFAGPLHPKLKSLDKNMANMSQKQIEGIQAIIGDKQNGVISQESVNKIRDYLDNKSIKSKQDTPEFIESYVNGVLSKNHSMDAKNLPYTSLKASLEQGDWFLYPESGMMFNVVKKQTEGGGTVLVQTTKDVLGNIDEKYYSDDFHSIDQFMKAINKFGGIYLGKLNDVDSPNKKNTVGNGENLPNSNEINNNLKKIFDTSYISKKDFESALVDIGYDNLSTSQLEKLLLEIDDTIPRDLYKLQSESTDSYNGKKLLAMRGEGLSDIEALCLRNYTGSEFRDYNGYLRAISSIFTKKTTKELLAIKIQTDILKRGMDKLAKVSSSDIKTLQKNNGYKESGLLFRGLSFNSNNELQTFLSGFKKNETWSDNGFLSTTINPNLNFAKVHPFKCTFVVRNENPGGVYINDFSMVCDEAEVLFPPGHKFKVFSEPKEVKPGERVIEIGA